MLTNKNCTRYYSNLQENRVAKSLGGRVVANSGGTKFAAGDVIIDSADMLVECKTSMTDKKSFSIQEEWVEKNTKDAFAVRKTNTALAFSFDSDASNVYYVINEKLMKFLVEKLAENS